MGSKTAIAFGLLGLGLPFLASIPVSASPTIPSTALVNAVADHLSGILDTTEQARQDPERPAVRMTTCPVTVIGADLSAKSPESPEGSVFLYQEQALIESLDEPYRQRILQIAPPVADSTLQSISYRPSETAALAGLCDRPTATRTLTTAQIGELTCRVFLTPVPQGFRGVTAPEGCPTQVRGAVRVTNEILLHDQGMDTWDRGFNAAGEQVWGATTVPYQFRR